ncbi:hypothetical protein RclHR1_00520031 [Rhizophagus clarus]|uniref:Uncharacterized protein n=1 Tax=Rhizophagus clarus TaxID=94130 RepID=A0A2Z6SER8_9GLOM|nr:hypothetical protein RclHR1_00520031 [Rhizophagus clarus]
MISNLTIEYPHYNLSSETENLFNLLLDTNSLDEYRECLCNITFDRKNNKEMIFDTDVLLGFAKKWIQHGISFS